MLLVVLGVVLGVYNATQYRDAKVNEQGNVAPTVGQSPPWYEGYAVEACGKMLAPDPDEQGPLRHHHQEQRHHPSQPDRKGGSRAQRHSGQVRPSRSA